MTNYIKLPPVTGNTELPVPHNPLSPTRSINTNINILRISQPSTPVNVSDIVIIQQTPPTSAEKERILAFTKKILLVLAQKQEYVDLLTEDMYVDDWYRAFTHISRDYEHNYEVYEKLGDGVMRLCFIEFLINANIVSDKVLTELEHAYITKTKQSEMSEALELTKIVVYDRRLYDLDIHISEDLIESLFGVIYSVGNKAFKERYGVDNIGLTLCTSLMGRIMKDTVSMDEAKGKSNSILKEIIDKLCVKSDIKSMFIVTKSDGTGFERDSVTIHFRFTEEVLQNIYNMFGCRLSQTYGRKTGRSIKSLKPIVATQVLEYLEQNGITSETIDIETFKTLVPEISNVHNNLLRKVCDLGFISYSFHNINKQNDHIVLLLGQRDIYGIKQRMIMGAKGSDVRELKASIIRRFLNDS